MIPYGVYDLAANTGCVSVGVDHNTPAFAVESIARWWRYMGKKTYPAARELFITADAGGSNSACARLWKLELQRFADRTGLAVSVLHFQGPGGESAERAFMRPIVLMALTPGTRIGPYEVLSIPGAGPSTSPCL